MRRCVCSRNLKNEEAMARVGPQRHREYIYNHFKFYVYHSVQKTQIGKHAKAITVSLVKILEPFCFFLSSSSLTQPNLSCL